MPRSAACPFFLGAILVLAPARAQEPSPTAHVLLLRPGVDRATAAAAKPFLASLESWLGEHELPLIGAHPTTHLVGSTERADAIRSAHGPVLAIVPAAYWYTALSEPEHLPSPEHHAAVVATLSRSETTRDRLALVARRDGGSSSLDELRGRNVHMQAGLDRRFLERAVFPADRPPFDWMQLQASTDLADDVFLLAEEPDDPEAPTALLLDGELCAFFERQDEELWQKLHVVWQSPELPRELVVALGKGWTPEARERVTTVLETMSDDDRGKALLQRMSADGFAAPDLEVLRSTRARFHRDRETSDSRPTSRPDRQDGARPSPDTPHHGAVR